MPKDLCGVDHRPNHAVGQPSPTIQIIATLARMSRAISQWNAIAVRVYLRDLHGGLAGQWL